MSDTFDKLFRLDASKTERPKFADFVIDVALALDKAMDDGLGKAAATDPDLMKHLRALDRVLDPYVLDILRNAARVEGIAIAPDADTAEISKALLARRIGSLGKRIPIGETSPAEPVEKFGQSADPFAQRGDPLEKLATKNLKRIV